MSTEKGFDFEHPIHFVERRKLLQTTAAVAAVGVLPVSAASVPKKKRLSPAARTVEALLFC